MKNIEKMLMMMRKTKISKKGYNLEWKNFVKYVDSALWNTSKFESLEPWFRKINNPLNFKNLFRHYVMRRYYPRDFMYIKVSLSIVASSRK